MHVIGTAGHVDHGKSTLVKALTGIDPDRLQAEKEREMSIVLGFAWLTLPGGEQVGIVDVPGHRDFIKNMLAGVGGIDAALLVIAADEGMMPQTREHLAILDLLQINGGVIALTKVDLVDDPEWIELVTADVIEQLEGTCLQEAPIVPVSAVTRTGLDALLVELETCLQSTPAQVDHDRPRLSVDRVFTVAGFGTVVTGTLIGGALRIGDEIELLPSGRRARIRGLQTHKTRIEQALPGSRVAVNLGGVSKDEVAVGEVVTRPGLLSNTQLIDVQLRYLAEAPQPLKHNTEVDFFCGAAEIAAHVRLLGADQLRPGETGWAQLRLARPAALVHGDRFILRWLSPSVTIGGGVVVDPLPKRRHRRFKPGVIERLETLAFGSPQEIVLQTLERLQPCSARELFRAIPWDRGAVDEALEALLGENQALVLGGLPDAGPMVVSGGSFLLSADGWHALTARIEAILGAYHASWPLRKGMPREELRSRLQERGREVGGKLFNQIVERAAHEGIVVADASSVWLAGHRVRFSAAQQRDVDALLATFRRAPLATPSVGDCEARLDSEVLNALVENGTLVRANADVILLGETLTRAQAQIVERIREQGDITLAQVRDMFHTSRKYAVAILEYLDEQRVTRRQGDVRVLQR